MTSSPLALQDAVKTSPLRPLALAAVDVVCEAAADGSKRMRSRAPLAPYDPSLARLFRSAVERNPSGLFLAERDAGGEWRKLTYEAARRQVDALGVRRFDVGPDILKSNSFRIHRISMAPVVLNFSATMPTDLNGRTYASKCIGFPFGVVKETVVARVKSAGNGKACADFDRNPMTKIEPLLIQKAPKENIPFGEVV